MMQPLEGRMAASWVGAGSDLASETASCDFPTPVVPMTATIGRSDWGEDMILVRIRAMGQLCWRVSLIVRRGCRSKS